MLTLGMEALKGLEGMNPKRKEGPPGESWETCSPIIVYHGSSPSTCFIFSKHPLFLCLWYISLITV